jgi:hypothetical protein
MLTSQELLDPVHGLPAQTGFLGDHRDTDHLLPQHVADSGQLLTVEARPTPTGLEPARLVVPPFSRCRQGAQHEHSPG